MNELIRENEELISKLAHLRGDLNIAEERIEQLERELKETEKRRDALAEQNNWCRCTRLKYVYRDGWSTCSKCGGKDAYGRSKDRPKKYKKTLEDK